MPNSEFPAIETRRLVLRPWEIADAPDVFRFTSDPEMYRYSRHEPRSSEDVVKQGIERWLGLPPESRRPSWVIVLKESGRVVGFIGFNQIDRVHASGRLDYAVARVLWGRGIATEATRAVIRHGFDVARLNRIDAYCFAGNVASQRVMEKAGMIYEGTLRQVYYIKGAHWDIRFYSVLAGEWKADPGSPSDTPAVS